MGAVAVRVGSVFVVSVLAAVSTAAAADWELTPFAGFRGGGELDVVEPDRSEDLATELAYGLVLGRVTGSRTALELVWSRQDTEVDVPEDFPGPRRLDLGVDHVHFAGVYRPERDGPRPFVSASAGFTRLHARPGGFGSEIELSLAASGGATVPLGRRLGLRLLGRAWLVFGDATLAGDCGGSRCTFEMSGGGMLQLEAAAGLVIGF